MSGSPATGPTMGAAGCGSEAVTWSVPAPTRSGFLATGSVILEAGSGFTVVGPKDESRIANRGRVIPHLPSPWEGKKGSPSAAIRDSPFGIRASLYSHSVER